MSYKVVEATVDGIKINYEDGEVEVTYDVSDNDVVRLTIEPLEVKVTDGFRAAVKKACNCDSSSDGGSGGSTGGGVLVVHESEAEIGGVAEYVLDKTWQEIANAMASGGAVLATEEGGTVVAASAIIAAAHELYGEYIVLAANDSTYTASSASGYPVLQLSGGGDDTPTT